ncbi:galactokinase [Desulfosarcina sp. OttesenSCG-928-A07]|nr:galactokinase [Desulfosarcina sp. OttesenSCG-928-G17]MDL2329779.1 galactokinase [Desulfosarcina sp. OttesenSCG-928-A07]
MTEHNRAFIHHPGPSLGNLADLLEHRPVTVSAPCRIDFGGTLDLGSFYCALRRHSPITVNIALNQRTMVRLLPEEGDRIRISSRGISDMATGPGSDHVFESGGSAYDHPLGLMAVIVDYFGARGVHVDIDSASPPRSGLGGSSVAAVALIAALSRLGEKMGQTGRSRFQIVRLAHTLEQAMAGVCCGLQDHLAAAYGGANAWLWSGEPDAPFSRHALVPDRKLSALNPHLLVAYLGVTHVSGEVNQTWVNQFIRGEHRDLWREIVHLTHDFARAVSAFDFTRAADAMNQETAIRRTMTPHVLESMGEALVEAAVQTRCGARFTGAGAGGCLWAMGEADDISKLKEKWELLLARRPGAGLMACEVDGGMQWQDDEEV